MKPTFKTDIRHEKNFKKGSRLVYGTSGLGGVWGEVDEKESVGCLLYALEHGIMSYDSAPSYNRAEEFLGKALAQWKGEKPFVSTKVGRLPAEKADECYVDYSAATMRQSVERSLKCLGVEQIDLLFLHEPHLVPLEQMDDIMETLTSFKEEGLVAQLGVGGNPTDGFRPYITEANFSVVSGFLKMDACNLSAFEKDVPHFQKEKVSYYAASSLHMALLGARFETYCADPPNNEWITNKDVAISKKINAIAKEQGISLPSLAQRYLFSVEEADRIVMGARKTEQIKASLEDWKAGGVEKDLFDQITETILTEGK